VPEEPALPPLVPVRASNANDGNYFVNCMHSDGTVSSGVAYYSNLNPGGNVNQQPDDYVDVAHGTNYVWEQTGSGEQNPLNGLVCCSSPTSVKLSFPRPRSLCTGLSLVVARRSCTPVLAPRTTASRTYGSTRTLAHSCTASTGGVAIRLSLPFELFLLVHITSQSFSWYRGLFQWLA